jgi:hypothetical protein
MAEFDAELPCLRSSLYNLLLAYACSVFVREMIGASQVASGLVFCFTQYVGAQV